MKSRLFLCILIIFSIGLLHAETNESEDEQCYEQWRKQLRLEIDCIHAVLNETELLSAINATFLDYAGDNEAVLAQTNKFCPILSTVIECSLIGFDLDKDCLTPVEIATKRQSYDLARALLNYVCANNSEIILQILQNNGFDTIYENEKTNECLRLGNGIQNINDETLRPSTELCDGVDKIYGCYANYVRDHKNQNLVRIAGEIKELHSQTIKCESSNQL